MKYGFTDNFEELIDKFLSDADWHLGDTPMNDKEMEQFYNITKNTPWEVIGDDESNYRHWLTKIKNRSILVFGVAPWYP